MTLEEWIRALPGTPTITRAAGTAQIQRTTLLRQLERGAISAENVIMLCRAHGKSPIDGLIETGYLDADELHSAGIPHALGHATNQQLLDEVMKRVDPAGKRLFHGGGITPRESPDDPQSGLVDPISSAIIESAGPEVDHSDNGGQQSG